MLTIASPNTDRTLLTILELRSAAGVTGSSRDTELRALGGYVSAAITKACRVAVAGAIPPTLRLESVSEAFRRGYHRCYRRQREQSLMLARRPVVTVTSVTEDDTLLAPATDYEFEGAAGLLYRLSGDITLYRVPWCAATVVVESDAGYATVPDDLKFAAIKFVKLILSQGDRDLLQKRETIPGVIEREWWVEPTREVGVPPEIMDLLEQGGFVNEVIV
jgi:hypothetical protein